MGSAKSCSFLPSSSSFAINNRSLSMLFSACNTFAYMPMATAGLPFSTFHRVALLIPARSETNSTDNFLRRRAILICSPIWVSIFCVCGNTVAPFLLIHTHLHYVYYYKQKMNLSINKNVIIVSTLRQIIRLSRIKVVLFFATICSQGRYRKRLPNRQAQKISAYRESFGCNKEFMLHHNRNSYRI